MQINNPKILYQNYILLCLGSLLLTPRLILAQPSIIETTQKSMPSFVDITAEGAGAVQSPHAAAAIDKNTGRLLVLRNVKTAYYKKTGAGVIIDSSGLIVTNYHTIANTNKITVTLQDNTSTVANIVRIFPQNDFVLLYINPPYPLIPIQFADSDAVQLGDEVFTVGHSELLAQTISGGRVIGLGTNHSKKEEGGKGTDMLQINMNLYKGDSGGPLLDRHGELIGLMVAGQTDVDRSSFAIPSNKIKRQYLEYLTVTQQK